MFVFRKYVTEIKVLLAFLKITKPYLQAEFLWLTVIYTAAAFLWNISRNNLTVKHCELHVISRFFINARQLIGKTSKFESFSVLRAAENCGGANDARQP